MLHKSVCLFKLYPSPLRSKQLSLREWNQFDFDWSYQSFINTTWPKFNATKWENVLSSKTFCFELIYFHGCLFWNYNLEEALKVEQVHSRKKVILVHRLYLFIFSIKCGSTWIKKEETCTFHNGIDFSIVISHSSNLKRNWEEGLIDEEVKCHFYILKITRLPNLKAYIQTYDWSNPQT